MSGPTAEGGDKHGPVKEPPPWSARLLSGNSVSYLRAVSRAGRGRSTPTSRIPLRPSVLDRHSVPLRGMEASNRSRVHASSPIPRYHCYLQPVLGTVGGPCSSLSSRSKGYTRTVHTPPPVWGCLCYIPPVTSRLYPGVLSGRGQGILGIQDASVSQAIVFYCPAGLARRCELRSRPRRREICASGYLRAWMGFKGPGVEFVTVVGVGW